jgi:NADP-dependent 3-hydroxy acid dehydrogenase YdfG
MDARFPLAVVQMGRYQDKVVWVTGASSGFGLELAKEFAREGATLVVSARREQNLKDLERQLGAKKVLVLPLDITDESSIGAAVEKVLNRFERIDVLCNNAGLAQRSLAQETELKVYRQLMDTNFFGAVALTQALLPTFIAQRAGHIVATSSVVGKFGAPLRAGYAAAKHALHGYFDSLRLELTAYHIKVTLIVLGAVNTEIAKVALKGDGTPSGKVDLMQVQAPAAQELVGAVIDGLIEGKRELIVGRGLEIAGLEVMRQDPDKFHEMALAVSRKQIADHTGAK